MKNVKQLLEEAGSELGHICKITIYLLDKAHRDEVYQVVGKWLKGVYPCSTGLIIGEFCPAGVFNGDRRVCGGAGLNGSGRLP